ncbi:MAG: hypothetical protein CMO61_09575 [Verrucomicrobiales bacterium]|jgi:hypothetical protein|nr:hypothetical protein [Verrucomicrobiales bacterium]|tara:strand:+ start:1294 stop:1557 length:264 start_codon:yes stop_codon:yes gene_type:complete
MSSPSKPEPEKRSFSDAFYDGIGAVLPGCSTALELVETGLKRPLTFREKFVLAYNSPLCLHCSCNRERFDAERLKLRELDRERRETT